MPRFITRIELFNANENDYAQLDNEIKKESFSRADNGDAKRIFAGLDEYYTEGNINIQQVTAAVLNATKKLGKKCTFTIIREKKGFFA